MEHKLEKQLDSICQYIENNVMMQKEFLTLTEAAKYAGISKSFLYKLTSQRQISFYRPSTKLIYFRRAELDSWILNNRSQTMEEVANPNLQIKKTN